MSPRRLKPITVYFAPEQLEALSKLSRLTRVPKAVYVREAVEGMLRAHALDMETKSQRKKREAEEKLEATRAEEARWWCNGCGGVGNNGLEGCSRCGGTGRKNAPATSTEEATATYERLASSGALGPTK